MKGASTEKTTAPINTLWTWEKLLLELARLSLTDLADVSATCSRKAGQQADLIPVGFWATASGGFLTPGTAQRPLPGLFHQPALSSREAQPRPWAMWTLPSVPAPQRSALSTSDVVNAAKEAKHTAWTPMEVTAPPLLLPSSQGG